MEPLDNRKLADAALELCQSHSTGVILVEKDGARPRSEASARCTW